MIRFFYTFFSELSASFSDQIRLSHKHRGFFCPIRFLASKSAFWSFGDTICGQGASKIAKLMSGFLHVFLGDERSIFHSDRVDLSSGTSFLSNKDYRAQTSILIVLWCERKCQFHGSEHGKGSTQVPIP